MTEPVTADWVRVTRATPCPICKKADWCMIGKIFVLCNRVPSDRPQKGGGYLHRLDSPGGVVLRPMPRKKLLNTTRLMLQWANRTSLTALAAFSTALGVSSPSLAALNAVWADFYRAWAFPMRDGHNDPVGIRLRGMDGRKWAVRGSSQGIFIPQIDPQPCAYICEGPTDTAAALDLGLFALGRPSCNGGVSELRTACRRLGVTRAVIVADNDDPGQQGATKMARELKLPFKLWTPAAKDIRRWLNLGGTRQLLEASLKNCIWQTP